MFTHWSRRNTAYEQARSGPKQALKETADFHFRNIHLDGLPPPTPPTPKHSYNIDLATHPGKNWSSTPRQSTPLTRDTAYQPATHIYSSPLPPKIDIRRTHGRRLIVKDCQEHFNHVHTSFHTSRDASCNACKNCRIQEGETSDPCFICQRPPAPQYSYFSTGSASVNTSTSIVGSHLPVQRQSQNFDIQTLPPTSQGVSTSTLDLDASSQNRNWFQSRSSRRGPIHVQDTYNIDIEDRKLHGTHHWIISDSLLSTTAGSMDATRNDFTDSLGRECPNQAFILKGIPSSHRIQRRSSDFIPTTSHQTKPVEENCSWNDMQDLSLRVPYLATVNPNSQYVESNNVIFHGSSEPPGSKNLSNSHIVSDRVSNIGTSSLRYVGHPTEIQEGGDLIKSSDRPDALFQRSPPASTSISNLDHVRLKERAPSSYSLGAPVILPKSGIIKISKVNPSYVGQGSYNRRPLPSSTAEFQVSESRMSDNGGHRNSAGYNSQRRLDTDFSCGLARSNELSLKEYEVAPKFPPPSPQRDQTQQRHRLLFGNQIRHLFAPLSLDKHYDQSSPSEPLSADRTRRSTAANQSSSVQHSRIVTPPRFHSGSLASSSLLGGSNQPHISKQEQCEPLSCATVKERCRNSLTTFMMDPYASSAREFVANRQILFLTQSRNKELTQPIADAYSCSPFVWIVNYYGPWSNHALQRIKPGSCIPVASTTTATAKEQDFSRARVNRGYPAAPSRLLGYLEANVRVQSFTNEHSSASPAAYIDECTLKLNRLIGRGGTSAVFSGQISVPYPANDPSHESMWTPAVIKILHQKHWKCALAELVASAAAIDRMSQCAMRLGPVGKQQWSRRDPAVLDTARKIIMHGSPAKTFNVGANRSPSTVASLENDPSLSSNEGYMTENDSQGSETDHCTRPWNGNSSDSGGDFPFFQGAAWLMPTELHLFWNLTGPPAVCWSGEKHMGEISQPQVSLELIPEGDALHSPSTDNEDLEDIISEPFVTTSMPRFAMFDSPSLCCLVLRNVHEGVPLLAYLNSVFVKRRCKPSHELCVYFAFIIISLVRQLHWCGLIHGDIKPDNFVLLPTFAEYPVKKLFEKIQQPNPFFSSVSGACPVTVAGIDFGRSLDVCDTLRDVVFVGDTQVSDFRCPSMIEKKSWETQIDLTGLAVTIFTIISLKYPKVRKKSGMLLSRNEKKHSGAAASRSTPLSCEYWFGSRVRTNPKQNEFWLNLLGRLINFEPALSEDGHTTMDSCRLLKQMEEELLGVFFLPDYEESQLKGHINTLYSDLNELYHMMKDGSCLSSPTPKQSQSTSGE